MLRILGVSVRFIAAIRVRPASSLPNGLKFALRLLRKKINFLRAIGEIFTPYILVQVSCKF